MEVNYIIQEPLELLDKFIYEAEKITALPNKYDFFNFVVTAAVLSEWIYEHYAPYVSQDFINTIKGKSESGLPLEAENWIVDKSCIPNPAQKSVRHILNSLRICWHTANATKHYTWETRNSSKIQSITDTAKINNAYDYFFTPVGEGLFIRFLDENYSIEQVKNILIQFYPKLIHYLEDIRKAQNL